MRPATVPLVLLMLVLVACVRISTSHTGIIIVPNGDLSRRIFCVNVAVIAPEERASSIIVVGRRGNYCRPSRLDVNGWMAR